MLLTSLYWVVRRLLQASAVTVDGGVSKAAMSATIPLHSLPSCSCHLRSRRLDYRDDTISFEPTLKAIAAMVAEIEGCFVEMGKGLASRSSTP